MGNNTPSTWEKTGDTDSADAATPVVANAAVTTSTAEPATWVMPPSKPKPAVAAAIPWFAARSWKSTTWENLPSYLVALLAAVECAQPPRSSRRPSSELLLLPLAVDAADGLKALILCSPCRPLWSRSHHSSRLYL